MDCLSALPLCKGEQTGDSGSGSGTDSLSKDGCACSQVQKVSLLGQNCTCSVVPFPSPAFLLLSSLYLLLSHMRLCPLVVASLELPEFLSDFQTLSKLKLDHQASRGVGDCQQLLGVGHGISCGWQFWGIFQESGKPSFS